MMCWGSRVRIFSSSAAAIASASGVLACAPGVVRSVSAASSRSLLVPALVMMVRARCGAGVKLIRLDLLGFHQRVARLSREAWIEVKIQGPL